jgi:hypothetical protein
MRKLVALCVACVSLAACVSHTWAPGPTATKPFGQASGECKLLAMGANQGTFAFGSQAYVAGAMIGGAIGNAVRQNTAYNACLEAQGFVAVDPQPAPAASPPARTSEYGGGGPGRW